MYYSITSCLHMSEFGHSMPCPWLIFLPHTHAVFYASAAITPNRSSSSRSSVGSDETGECFDQGRGVTGRGADERNTPSQLETKERPAKGPIAQS